MAVWQFDCMIIPKNRDIKDCQDIDEYISWLGVGIPESSFEFLSKFLPLEKSWTNQIKQYGNNDSTCIELYLLNDDIEEIRCRFDLRSISISLISNMINFINMINGRIFYDGNTIEANMKSVIKLLKESDATRFCNNPMEFIQHLDSTN